MSGFNPKRWMSDNETEFCSNCNDQFSLLNRKHHCRACGRLLCAQCCSLWLLIPKVNMMSAPGTLDDHTIPQRCCSSCSHNFQGLQSELRHKNSKANATLRFDKDSSDRNMNVPVSRKLETDIRKAAHTLYNFTKDDPMPGQGKDGIPKELIKLAKGIVFVTLLKAGFLFSGRVGTGLVIAKLDDGSWSAPSAIVMSGMGWGFQAGGELTDVILILTTQGAVNAFCSKAQISIGTELAVSLGPVGRSAGGDVSAGTKGTSAAFSYAHSKGLFFGISLEATVIASRPDINRQFYGMEITPTLLLNGVQPRPRAAEPLYKALEDIMSGFDDGHGLVADNEEGFSSFNSAAHSMVRDSTSNEQVDDDESFRVVTSSPIDRGTGHYQHGNHDQSRLRADSKGRVTSGWEEGEATSNWSPNKDRDPRLRSVESENADLLRAKDKAASQRNQQMQQHHEREMSARGSFTSFSDLLPSSGKRRETANGSIALQQRDLEAELDSLLLDENRWDDEDNSEEEQEVVTFEPPKRGDVKKDDKEAVEEKNTATSPLKSHFHKPTKPVPTSDVDSTVWNFSDEVRRRKVQEDAARTFHSRDSSEMSDDGDGSGKASGVYEEIRF